MCVAVRGVGPSVMILKRGCNTRVKRIEFMSRIYFHVKDLFCKYEIIKKSDF